MKWYTTQELAEAMHCSVRQVRRLHKYGLIQGIRTARGYVFHELEIANFWNTYRGADLSNEDKIRLAAIKKGDAREIRPRTRTARER